MSLGWNVGSEKNSKGYKETWVGYKLHLDVADGQIPISCILEQNQNRCTRTSPAK